MIYAKTGMERMPLNCRECKYFFIYLTPTARDYFQDHFNCDIQGRDIVGLDPDETKPTWCPLIEVKEDDGKHGCTD